MEPFCNHRRHRRRLLIGRNGGHRLTAITITNRYLSLLRRAITANTTLSSSSIPPDEIIDHFNNDYVSSDDNDDDDGTGDQVKEHDQESAGLSEQNPDLVIIDSSSTPLRKTVPASLFWDDVIEEEKEEVEGSDTDNNHEAEHHHQKPEIQEIPDPELEIRANLRIAPISQILCGIPQNPYYHLRLHRYSELTRRNLAAAWDRTFEDTAKQLLELNIEKEDEDNWARAPDLWKTMGEMQGMVYNVLPMRRRFMKMTELREKKKEEEFKMQMLLAEHIFHLLEKGMMEYEMNILQIKNREEDVHIEGVRNGIDRSREKIMEYDDAIHILAMKPLMDDDSN